MLLFKHNTTKLTALNEKGHNGSGDYEIIIKNTNVLEYIMSLIKVAIE